MEIKIYGLFDPREPDIIKYVGKTKMSLRKRLQAHIDESRRKLNGTYKIHWVNSLCKENIKPDIKILEICTEDNWQEREKYWIKTLTNLTNSTEGGEVINHVLSPISQYTTFGVFTRHFNSIDEACSELNIERGVINSALQRNPEGGYGGGFLWRYSYYAHKKFITPYINPQNKVIRVIDLVQEKSYLFESIKEALSYLNIKRCGNVSRCIKNRTVYKDRYYFMQVN